MATETRRIQFDFIARDRGVSRQMEETAEQAEEMNAGLEDGAGRTGKLSGAMAKLGPLLTGVAAAAAVIGPAIMKGLDAQAATAKFQAQLGLTAKESQRIGGVAGKLYSSAYGESMDEVRTAITAVIRNMDGMRTASAADLQQTSARAMDLATVMGEDVGRATAAVSQIMRTGLARNSREAFDIMTRGAQLGANKAEDLADTFEEYGVQFKNMGLSGKQAMGLIVQGLQAGGRNADLVADTIKEFSIEAVAGGERVMKGFKSLGLNAEQMSQAFAKGGPGAAKALDLMLDKLRAIKDPVERNKVAIELFGTKAEDMGKALFALDPSEATKKLGAFKGATDAAGKAMGSTLKARLTSFKRTLETQVTNAAGRALNGLAKLSGEVKKGFKLPAMGKAANDFQKFGQMMRQVADWTRTKLVPALKDMANFLQKKIIPQAVKFYREVLGELGKQIKRVAGELDKSGVPWGKILKVMKTVVAFAQKYLLKLWSTEFKIALKIAGTWIVFCIKVFKLLWREGERVYANFKRGAKIIQDWYKRNKSSIDGFKNAAMRGFAAVVRTFLNFVSTMLRGAVKAFGWVPGVGGKLKGAAKEFEKFKNRVNSSINGITKKKSAFVTVTAKGKWDIYGSGIDKSVLHYHGGPITGEGQPGASRHRDSVFGILRKDEHVVTPEEVDGAGGHQAVFRIRKAMRKGLLKGFFNGGPAGVNVVPRLSSAGQIRANVNRPVDAGYTRMLGNMASLFAKIWKQMMGGGGVVAAARSMLGWPYSWGGGGKGGPSFGIGRGAGTRGFDCSGLTEFAWWKGARKSIGGTTFSQWPNSRPTGRRPGALGFPHMNHVVLASNRPGYIIEAPFTGAHVREVRSGRSYNWRWPKYYAGGPVGQFGAKALHGPNSMARLAQALGILGDPRRHRAAGGPVSANSPYLVGEQGAEVFVPRAIGTVHSAGTKVVNVTQNINFTVQATPGTNRAALGREVNELLLEYKARGGKLATNGRAS